jgi:type IV pilus secretin PilQ/predicted competence protein
MNRGVWVNSDGSRKRELKNEGVGTVKVKKHHVDFGRRFGRMIAAGGCLLWILGTASMAVAQEEGVPEELLTAEVGSKDLGERGGRLIPSLDLNNAEMSVVLRAIAKFSGLNIVAGEDVQGNVSLFLSDVTVKSALDAILATNGYAYIHKNNVVYVLSAEKLGEDKVQTITRVFFLQYLDAAEVEESISEVFGGGEGNSGGGSGGGNTISSNPSSNSIIITDTPDQVDKIVSLLTEIDRPFKQVRIESRLVELRLTNSLDFGINWSFYNENSPENRFDFNNAPRGRSDGLLSSPGMFQFGMFGDGAVVSGYLQAEAETGNIRILANPSVTVKHNTRAEIKITNELPVIEANISQGTITESVSYQETGITLEVTPRINDQGDITMKVRPTQRIAGARVVLQNSSAFPIDTRTVETELRVPDSATFVIGGLRSNDVNKTHQKVPLLGDIPILGLAFSRKVDQDIQNELLLFVTPTIVKDFVLNTIEQKRYDTFENMNQDLYDRLKKEEEAKAKKEDKRMQQELKKQQRQQREAERQLLREEEERMRYEQEKMEMQTQRLQQEREMLEAQMRLEEAHDQLRDSEIQHALRLEGGESTEHPATATRHRAGFDWEGDWAMNASEPSRASGEGIQVQGQEQLSLE